MAPSECLKLLRIVGRLPCDPEATFDIPTDGRQVTGRRADIREISVGPVLWPR